MAVAPEWTGTRKSTARQRSRCLPPSPRADTGLNRAAPAGRRAKFTLAMCVHLSCAGEAADRKQDTGRTDCKHSACNMAVGRSVAPQTFTTITVYRLLSYFRHANQAEYLQTIKGNKYQPCFPAPVAFFPSPLALWT